MQLEDYLITGELSLSSAIERINRRATQILLVVDECRRLCCQSGAALAFLKVADGDQDGHGSHNRHRDYRIEIRPFLPPWGRNKPKGWERRFDASPLLAESRVRDFHGGVYHRFVLNEGRYTLRIHKSGSFNTTLAGVFLDKIDGPGRLPAAFSPDNDPAFRQRRSR